MVYGQPALHSAYLRRDGGGSELIDDRASFQVITAQAEPAIAPDSQRMTLPHTFRWRVKGKTDQFDIYATIDTPMLFGLADGYVGGYKWQGTHNDKPVTGRGYIEYIDKRGS